MFIPVIDKNQCPLMPTSPYRARKWIKSGKATPFWRKGVFHIRLNKEPSNHIFQEIAVGIDTGSKREAFTVKSKAHTYLNILSDAVTWVKDANDRRRNARKFRRYRNAPHRKNKLNRKTGGHPPSTMARWQVKLRIVNFLFKSYPINFFIVEDVKAKIKGKKKWDMVFSPLEIGKTWFYGNLMKLAPVELIRGWDTKKFRDELKLKKSGSKLSESFYSHNVDSWVMANHKTGGHKNPDNTAIHRLIPLQLHRRQLHAFYPAKNGLRRRYGGTRSMGFKRGSLIKSLRYGLCYVGGNRNGRISVHSLYTGERIDDNVRVSAVKFKAYSSFRWKAEFEKRKEYVK